MNGESNEIDCNSDGMRADNSMWRRGRRWISRSFGIGIVGSIHDTGHNGHACAASEGCIHPSACAYENACIRNAARYGNASTDACAGAASSVADYHHQQHQHEYKYEYKYEYEYERLPFFIRGFFGFLFGVWIGFFLGVRVGGDNPRPESSIVPRHDVVHPVQK